VHLGLEPECVQCGSTDQLEVDHIIEVADGGSLYDHANLQTLCHQHHEEKSKGMGRHRRTHE
jgi:5-methylcytosine-specific restriction endonuclease McrA